MIGIAELDKKDTLESESPIYRGGITYGNTKN
jgi:hypothetical protein